MNYLLIRGIIFVTIVFITIVLFFLFKEKNKKFKIFLLIISIILFNIIYCFPIEKYFMNFKKVDDAFKYYFPTSEIIKKYEYTDYAYIIFYDKNPTRGDSLKATYITKTNDRWKIDNILNKNCDTIKAINKPNEHYHMSQLKIPNEKTMLVRIDYLDFKLENPEIYDSISSNIDVFYTRVNDKVRVVTLVVVFDESNIEKLNEDYSIYFNGNDHKVLKGRK